MTSSLYYVFIHNKRRQFGNPFKVIKLEHQTTQVKGLVLPAFTEYLSLPCTKTMNLNGDLKGKVT